MYVCRFDPVLLCMRVRCALRIMERRPYSVCRVLLAYGCSSRAAPRASASASVLELTVSSLFDLFEEISRHGATPARPTRLARSLHSPPDTPLSLSADSARSRHRLGVYMRMGYGS
jgi:hypothetical protein